MGFYTQLHFDWCVRIDILSKDRTTGSEGSKDTDHHNFISSL
jgi:hypothetical protein